jgi:DGQHR domain-containing protein
MRKEVLMKCIVLRGINLNTEVYRGFASIADLARVSASDSFNQQSNPDGLQRDLNSEHARQAYRYAKGDNGYATKKRAWAEVLLNVREPGVVRLSPLDEGRRVFELEILEDLIKKDLPRPQISRTDGNHRLHLGAGDRGSGWEQLDVPTPFAMTIGLTPNEEATVFMDVNDNQRAMNTSHLAHLKFRLSDNQELRLLDPALLIAERLADDPHSAWHGVVYKGGQRPQGMKRRVNLASLKTGVEMFINEAIKMRPMDVDAKYAYVLIFWNAVKETYSTEWTLKESPIQRGLGIWTFSQLGADIIDRCIVRGVMASKLKEEMCGYLRLSQRVFNWHTTDDFQGVGGRSGARAISNKMKAELSDEEVNLKQLEAAVKNLA